MLASGFNEVIALELETPSFSLAARSLDAPLFYSGNDCDPGAIPAPGASLVMYTADASLAASQTWAWVSGGQIILQSNKSLCAAAGPRTDPSTGQPALELALCSDALAETFTARNGEIVATAGGCVDITSHGNTDGSALELYACNGGDNQIFAFKVTKVKTSLSPDHFRMEHSFHPSRRPSRL